ncbi:MAG: hypothetical protein PHC61_04225 [Chitinivibrionales bacterium]|nr:hypothetical protein [Chitinivibrionales bacterium]
MNGEYIVSTDKKEKIKLDSAIIYADWLSQTAYGGTEAMLEVQTVFVAEGSAIEIKATNSKGKSPAIIKGKIFNDKFTGKLLIPEKVEQGALISFEAKLPKHGLKLDSFSQIPTAPLFHVTKMAWDRKEVKRGDIVSMEAEFEQIADETEALLVVYEYDQDGNHERVASFSASVKSRKVKVQWEFDFPRDTSQIPAEAELQKHGKHYQQPQFYFIVVVDGLRIGEKQESGLVKFIDYIDFTFNNPFGRLPKDHDLVLYLPDGTNKKIALDDNGHAFADNLPPGPTQYKWEKKS